MVAVYSIDFPSPLIPGSDTRHTMVETDVRASYLQHPVWELLISMTDLYIGTQA